MTSRVELRRSAPPEKSVAEVKVLTTVPPAEYGHSAGGVISVVKKSGTNESMEWHRGKAALDACSIGCPTPTKSKRVSPHPGRPNGVPVFFMRPDANFAGPIVKNKTFFFIGYQRLHEKKLRQVDATTPTELMKAGNFNFPGVTSNVIYDPATTRRDSNGNWTRDPFPGNIIPANRFDPVARNLLAL